MTQIALSLIVGLVEEAIKDAPGLIVDFKKIFSTADPVNADWQGLKAKVASESYEQYVPGTAIPKDPTA